MEPLYLSPVSVMAFPRTFHLPHHFGTAGAAVTPLHYTGKRHGQAVEQAGVFKRESGVGGEGKKKTHAPAVLPTVNIHDGEDDQVAKNKRH